MATKETETAGPPKPEKPAARKLADDFQPNEPTSKSGLDKDGHPDDSLSAKQVERAATEAMLSLRPQPSAEEMNAVFDKLGELTPEGQPAKKFKTAKEAGDAAVAALNEGSK